MKKAKVVKTFSYGAMRIDVREYRDGKSGAPRYGFDLQRGPYDRKKVRLLSLKDAEEEAKRNLGLCRGGTVELLKVNPLQFARFLEWQAAQQPSASVADVVRDFMEDKRILQIKRELSEKYVRDLSGTLEPNPKFPKASLVENFSGSITEMAEARKAVEKWLTSRPTGPRRFNNQLAHVVSLIRYARAHKYVGVGDTPVEDIPRRKVTPKKDTFTPAELSALLRTVPLKWLPAVVVGAFCGIRPEEICPEAKSHKTPLQWEDFMWHKNAINVQKHTVKVGDGRYVPMCETALAWLEPWRKARGPIAPRQKMSNRTRKWAAAAGIEWKPDVLRHSYASYMLAITENIAQLSQWLGNSVDMIRRHYLDRKMKDEALEYFALTPEKVGREDLRKIVLAA